MAKKCDICKRNYLKANTRSHSNIATIKRQKINLQTTIVDGKKVKACVKCIRTKTKKAVA